ncbi:uncharacterized protein LOC134719128 [Mytilus trossulus]|uniref:uncharacterized protein LOC134719128 n=1 Tax=Mytilus trossulus TaxID=6551 RepID=UPI003004B413
MQMKVLKAAIIAAGIIIIISYLMNTLFRNNYYSNGKDAFHKVTMTTVGLLKPNSFESWLSFWGPHMLILSNRQKAKGSKIEGHIWSHRNSNFLRKSQLLAYYRHIMKYRHTIRRICEIGFNGGHSALMWAILFKGNIDIVVFDTCIDKRCDIGEELIREMFPKIRLKVVRGDSTKTVPIYRHNNPNVKCDFISIDGGHLGEVPKTDLLYMQYLAADNNIIVMDDVNIKSNETFEKTVGKAWKYAITNKLVKQIGECNPCTTDFTTTCQFCFGKYLKNMI